MSISTSCRRGLIAAGSFAFLIAAAAAARGPAPGLQPDRQDQGRQEQAGHQPQAASDAADRDAGRQAAARQDQAAGGLQGRGLVERPSRRPHHGDGRQGHDVHGHARDRPRLCHHRQGRQARGQGHHPGPDAAERARLQGRLALRVRDQQGLSLRQDRGQSRQAAGAGRTDRRPTICRTRSTTTGNTWRSDRTARCTCRSARTATSARSIPAPTARSAATTRTAPAWRSWRAASATRSASTGIR